MLNEMTFARWVERSVGILAGPGFGADGMTVKEALSKLVKEGLAPQEAYFVVLAGRLLAKDRGISLRHASTSEDRLTGRYLSKNSP